VRKRYTTDLTDVQWTLVEPLIPPQRNGGDRRTSDMREVVNAILYLTKNGCAWRDLPGDFPPYQTVYGYFSRWRDDGTWQAIYEVLHRRWRTSVGREETPSAAVMDSQSVQAAEEAESRGSDASKRVKGRKRHLMVDTEGLPVAVVVTDASANDKAGARLLLAAVREVLPRLRRVWADAGYESGPLAAEARTQQVEPRTQQVELEVVKRNESGGFVVMARRWVVERTFAWLMRSRRLCRDFERLARTVESLIYVAMTRLLLNRLAPTS
jgi:putative transposase